MSPVVDLDVAERSAAQRLAGLAAGSRELGEAGDDEVGGDAFVGAHWARSIGADGAPSRRSRPHARGAARDDRGLPDVPERGAAADPVGARGPARADRSARRRASPSPCAACRSRAPPAASSSAGWRRSASSTTSSMLERFAFASVAKCYPGSAARRPRRPRARPRRARALPALDGRARAPLRSARRRARRPPRDRRLARPGAARAR